MSPLLVASLAAAPLVLQDVTVVDVETGRLRPNTTVVVEGDRIARLGPAGSVPTPTGADVVDGKGRFLIPGLWDMHVHLVFGDWLPGAKEIALPLFLANGVTGVRDMGGDLQTATLRPAEFLAMEDRLGRVEQGRSRTSCCSTRCCAAWSGGPRDPRWR